MKTPKEPIETTINKESVRAAIQHYEEAERQREFKETQKKKFDKLKSILASIPLSALGFIEVYLIYTVIVLAIALVFGIILNIPILSTLFEWFFKIREDTPDMFAMFLATTAAYYLFKSTVEHIIKNIETQRFTMMLTGIYIILLNIKNLIINLSNNDAILANIMLSVLGIIIFYKGKTICAKEEHS